MKKIFTSILLTLSVTTFAQIPSYVPSNGLVGWWPFNGNANDESGNGNNGTVNGATLTTDRFGVAAEAYNFDGVDDYIDIGNNNNLNSNIISISVWYNALDYGSAAQGYQGNLVSKREQSGWGGAYQLALASNPINLVYAPYTIGGQNGNVYSTEQAIGQWVHVVYVHDLVSARIYINGILSGTTIVSGGLTPNTLPVWFGSRPNAGVNSCFLNGQLDDIGIWNRALTEAEIATLFAGCNLSVTTQPQDQSVNASAGTASFITASSSATATYQWQTNLGLGFQNLSNAGQYSGSTSATLTVSSLSMSNNNQVFRCIINDSGCTDTTSEAVLTIIDDASVQSNTPTTFKLYPNPVKDELFIKGMQEAVLPFEVYSTDGKKVLSGTTSGAIDVNALKKGSYQLKMKEQTIPFVKQ